MSAKRWPLDLDASDQGERVRFCLGCGAVMDYALTDCPACGHANPPAPGSDDGPLAPCPSCRVERAASLLYCPACGAPAEEEASFRAEPGSVPEAPAATAASVLAVTLALVAPALVLAALLHALGAARGTGA
jgi:hypothetical protein